MKKKKAIMRCVAFLCSSILIINSLFVCAEEEGLPVGETGVPSYQDNAVSVDIEEGDSEQIPEILDKTDEEDSSEKPEDIPDENSDEEVPPIKDDMPDADQDVPETSPVDDGIDIPDTEINTVPGLEDQQPITNETLDTGIEEEKIMEGGEDNTEIVLDEEVEPVNNIRTVVETPIQQYVRRLYVVLLERQPDAQGLNTYTSALEKGKTTASSVVLAIVNSSEFTGKRYSDQVYVEKLYAALLNRNAGNTETSEWVGKINEGVSGRFVLFQIVKSSEFTKVCNDCKISKGDIPLSENRDKNYKLTAYVSRCYRSILGRSADIQGLNTWTGALLSGKNGSEIVRNLVLSNEFKRKGKSDSEFIDILYQAMLGRASDVGGKANWLDCLEKGVSYQYIINGFAGSREFKNLCASYGIVAGKIDLIEARDKNIGVTGFVVRNYKVVLGRKPDTAGLNNWCKQINDKTRTPAQVAHGFIFSKEAINKRLNNADFVELLYKTCLGRSSDPKGKQNWVNKLNTGTTRETVFWGFANSSEFKKMIAEFGLTGAVYEPLTITSCSSDSYTGSRLRVSIHANRSPRMEKIASSLYMVLLNSKGDTIISSKRISSSIGNDWVVNAEFDSSDSFRTATVGKYAIAAMVGDSLQILSNSLYLSNPEVMAKTTRIYPGFAEGELSSKKGMQGVHANATEALGIQAALLNVKLNELIRTNTNVARYGSACYVPYTYKGKTYYFHDMISYMKTVKALNGWTDEYGGVRRNVTLNLLLGWDNELQYLIHPSARAAGKAYYTLNMSEENARATFEALFCYMAEKLGGSVLLPSEHSTHKYRVANWVLGNEVNACKAWNYSGNMSTKECADNYAQAFQILYQGVKKTDSEARVFVSLDHDWNAEENGHGGKPFLDEFASYMYATAPHMRWNVNYHPYSQPLTRNDFWNDHSNTTSNISTRFISMRNLDVLTNYLGEMERKYFPNKGDGYIRVILGEQGFVASNKSQEALQAAAIGYGFYIASMNPRVDAYIIRAYKDDPAEGVMKQGVMYQDETPKEAYNVYAKLGTKDSINCMNAYIRLVNNNASSWTQIVPGLRLDMLYH